jgi:molybdopterin synthase sulfur carrier subunit
MQIHIPTPLRSFTGGQETVTVAGATVAATLDQLTTDFPALRQHLFSPEGKLRSFVNVYLNDDDIRYIDQKEATPVKESIAGGSSAMPDATACTCCSCCCLPLA